MGDVDIYTDASNYPVVYDRLLSAGYQLIQTKHRRHISFTKNHLVFELHSEIKGIPNGIDGIPIVSKNAEKRIRLFLSDLTESAIPFFSPQYGRIIVPDDTFITG